MSSPQQSPGFDPARQLAVAKRAVAKQSLAVLATSSARNRPHAVGLLYAAVDLTLYFLVGENTIKARNVREHPDVAVCIPVRKYPFSPPMAVQFQGTGEVLAPDDPHITSLLETNQLKRITAHGTGGRPGACFIKVVPGRRISTYGLGIPLIRLLRDVASGARSVELP